MERLQHDPRMKKQIKDALCAYVYAKPLKQFQLQLDTLIIRNTLLGGYSERSLTYKEILYTLEKRPDLRKRNKLLPQLKAQMDSYLKEFRQLTDEELPVVMGYITRVLNASNDLGDHLQLLPESVHYPVLNLFGHGPHPVKMDKASIQQFIEQNQKQSDMMKHRMMLNLLI